MDRAEEITLAQIRLAKRDELDIESELLRLIEKDESWSENARLELMAALRTIDQWKAAGVYDERRAELSAYVDKQTPETSAALSTKLTEKVEPGETHFENFCAGLASEDHDERRAFEAIERLLEKAGVRNYFEAVEYLAALKRVKGRGGRPKLVTPWQNYASSLDAMRLLIAQGESLHQASLKVASQTTRADGEADRATELRKQYRARQSLRQPWK